MVWTKEERGKLLYTFNLRYERRLSIIVSILGVFAGLFVIWGSFYGAVRLAREGIFHYIVIVVGLMFIYIGSQTFIYGFSPDLKIYERGFVYPLPPRSYIPRKKELFIPFKDVESIEMTTIPIGVKCLKIKTSRKTYEITKKQLREVEEIYQKLQKGYLEYKNVSTSL